MSSSSSIVPGSGHKVHRGRRSKDKILERRDVYRELVSTAMGIIYRVQILHRTFAEESDYPSNSWLHLYADNPYLSSTLRKMATKIKPFSQYTCEDIQAFYDNLTHEEFKRNLIQATEVNVTLPVEDVRQEVVVQNLFSTITSFDNSSVNYQPYCKDPVTLEMLSSLPHEDRIFRVLPPLNLTVNIRAELRTELQPPRQLLSYCEQHAAQKRRGFSILLYTPPNSGIECVEFPAPVMNTDDFDNWVSSFPICVTNIFSLLGKGVINIAVIPEENVFSDRMHKFGCVCDGSYCHLRYLDVLASAKDADIIHYTNKLCGDIDQIVPKTLDISDPSLKDFSPPDSPVLLPHDRGPDALPSEPPSKVGIG